MSTKHCPLCNAKQILAHGAVVYSNSVLVEHSCSSCGHLFYLGDRRAISKDASLEESHEHYLAEAFAHTRR